MFRKITLLLTLMLSVVAVQAATFTVNSVADTDDGTCNAANCTLREAINAANATPAVDDDIEFAFTTTQNGPGWWIIQPTTALPQITSPLNIDGGDPANPSSAAILVQLDGSSTTGSVNGLTFVAGADAGAGSSVTRLSVTSFRANGIAFQNLQAARSGQALNGQVTRSNIGLTPDGQADGNDGTNSSGVFISNSSHVAVGAIASAFGGTASNTIGYSFVGVAVLGGNSQYNPISQNSFVGNQSGSILIQGAGQNDTTPPNDPDLDEGPNAFLNKPVIQSITLNGGNYEIDYFLPVRADEALADGAVFDNVATFLYFNPDPSLGVHGQVPNGVRLVNVFEPGNTYNANRILTYTFPAAELQGSINDITLHATLWNGSRFGPSSDMSASLSTIGDNFAFTGQVYDDVNYGGGDGRAPDVAQADASGFNVFTPNTIVELYAADGSWLDCAVTDATGSYQFVNLNFGLHHVRVVNETVRSARGSGIDGLMPVQLFQQIEVPLGEFGNQGTRVTPLSIVGGREPANADATWHMDSSNDPVCGPVITAIHGGAANSGVTGPITTASGFDCDNDGATFCANSRQTIGSSASGAIDIDFGFNFSTIVNTNNSRQGSLKQFVENANALPNTNLDQDGIDNGYGLDTSVVKEVSLFEIPTTDANYDSATQSFLIDSGSAGNGRYDELTDPVRIDGDTQTIAGFAGDDTPKIAVHGGGGSLNTRNSFFANSGGNYVFRNLAITGMQRNGAIVMNDVSDVLIERNYIGRGADGTSNNGDANSDGVELVNVTNAVIGSLTDASLGNVIAGNTGSGIDVRGGSNVQIGANLIGLEPDETIGGNQFGINVTDPADLVIGAPGPGRNIIGFNQLGILLGSNTASLGGFLIQNNYIGVQSDGSSNAGNGGFTNSAGSSTRGGLSISARSCDNVCLIGGTGAGEGNVIGFNGGAGLQLSGSGIDVFGNLIGANASGADIGNVTISKYRLSAYNGSGVVVTSFDSQIDQFDVNTTDIQIGGINAGEANIIANNARDGVYIGGGPNEIFQPGGLIEGVAVRGNRIYGNGTLGINIDENNTSAATSGSEYDGITPNDGLNPTVNSSVTNAGMDYPVITAANEDATGLNIQGYVGTLTTQIPGAAIDFYVAEFGICTDPIVSDALECGEVIEGDGLAVDHGESARFGFARQGGCVEGSTEDADPRPGFFDCTVSGSFFANGNPVTATATLPGGNTSEFGPNFLTVFPTGSVSGTIYEDINYGGGIGRAFDPARGMVPLEGVEVVIYRPDGSNWVLAQRVTTDENGVYNYEYNGSGFNRYLVRVENSQIRSTRPGGDTCTDCLPVQTYRADGLVYPTLSTAEADDAGANEVGGREPFRADSTNSPNGIQIDDVEDEFQSFILVDNPGGVDLTGNDFGFNFSTIVNTNDAGQGSLRQFVINSNALDGDTDLTQVGAGTLNAGIFNGHGVTNLRKEISIFMIPSPDDVQNRPTDPNCSADNVCEIVVDSSLPAFTAPVILDGYTQLGSSLNTVAQSPAAGGNNELDTELRIVLQSGVSSTTGQQVPNGIDVTAGQSVVRGFSVLDFSSAVAQNDVGSTGFGIRVSGGQNAVEGNFVGLRPDGRTRLGNREGIVVWENDADSRIGGSDPEDRNLIADNGNGILITAHDNVNGTVTGTEVYGNLIGTDFTGIRNVVGSNSSQAINVRQGADNVTIGGDGLGEANVLAGNGGGQINMSGVPTSATIEGNYIGIGANGVQAVPNSGPGILITGSSGVTVTENFIGNTSYYGVLAQSNVADIVIDSNSIGVAADGSAAGVQPLRQSGFTIGGWGVQVKSDDGVVISNNTIANSFAAGVRIQGASTSNTTITENSIYANGENNPSGAVGIDLTNGGELTASTLTPNDALDTDTGANNLLNFPVLTSALLDTAELGVVFTLDINDARFSGAANAGYRVEFFANDTSLAGAVDPSGHGEGQQFLCSVTVSGDVTDLDTSCPLATSLSENAVISATTTACPVVTNGVCTETAETSEFSENIAVAVNGPAITGMVYEDINYGGISALNANGQGRDYDFANSSAEVSGFSVNPTCPGDYVGVADARVELYDANDNSFIAATTTDACGDYSFTATANTDYIIRVVNETVTSVRSVINTTNVELIPVQTFRSDGVNEAPDTGANRVGGEFPCFRDEPANTNNADFVANSGTVNGDGDCEGTVVQSFVNVSVTDAELSDINFGFNFSTIVNTNNEGQGSLRQMVVNANALANAGLNQQGIDNQAGLNAAVTKEATVFMIPTVNDPLLRVPDFDCEVDGSDVCAISLGFGQNITTNGLPEAIDPIYFNGLTQNGATANTATVASQDPLNADLKIIIDSGNFTSVPNNSFIALAGTGNHIVEGISFQNDYPLNETSNRHDFIEVENADNVVVQGNYFGTDITGINSTPRPARFGVFVTNGDGIQIGGTTPESRNLFSGNISNRIRVGGATGVKIQGNIIGLDATGKAVQDDASGVGIFLVSATETSFGNTVIGGETIAARNVIAGLSQPVILSSNEFVTFANNIVGLANDGGADPSLRFSNARGVDSSDNNNLELINNVIGDTSFYGFNHIDDSNVTMQGNIIGFDINQSNDRGVLGGPGVLLTSRAADDQNSSFTIGGASPVLFNTIANNDEDGITVSGLNSESITVLCNSIYNNGEIAIDLDEDAFPNNGINNVTDNDVDDGDTGNNNLINYPVITEVATSGSQSSQLDITFDLDIDDTSGHEGYLIQFYANDPTVTGAVETFDDPDVDTFHGEGQQYFCSTVVSGDSPAGGHTATCSAIELPEGAVISSTTTACPAVTASQCTSYAETSEFGPNVAVDDIEITLTAQNDSVATTVGTPASGNVTTNDDTNGANLVVNTMPVTAPTNGQLVLNADGTYIYTPNADFEGTDTFEYEVCVEGETPPVCDTASVTITVLNDGPGVNDAPIAQDDDFDVVAGTTLTSSVIGNDVDPDSDNLIVTTAPVSPPTNGTLVLNEDGTFSYMPNAGFTGPDSFEYEVCDGPVGDADRLCDTAVVTLNVADDPTPEVNKAPDAKDDIATVTAGQSVTVDVRANDTDPNGDPLANPTIDTQPQNGTVTVKPDGTIIYTPNPGFTGNDSFVYEVCDTLLPPACSLATVSVTVTDDVRVDAQDDSSATRIGTPVDGNVLTNDVGSGGDLVVTTDPTVEPTNGQVTLNADGSYTYTPNIDFEGTDSFEYQVCVDGIVPAVCDTATVTVTVFNDENDVNDAPIAQDDDFTVFADNTLSSNVLGNDVDPDTGDELIVTTVPVTPPTNGVLTLQADGTFSYTPTAGFTGPDSFEYEVCDRPVGDVDRQCDTAIVTINVQEDPNPELNEAPEAKDDVATVDQGDSVAVDVRANDTDPNGDPLANPTIETQPQNGTVVVNPDGTITYTPDPDFSGNDSFVYEVCDTGSPAECAQATVSVTVKPDNVFEGNKQAGLLIDADNNSLLNGGDTLRYVITYDNQGNGPDVTGLQIIDNLDDALTFVIDPNDPNLTAEFTGTGCGNVGANDVTNPSYDGTDGNDTIFAAPQTLPANCSVVVTIDALVNDNVPAETTISNQANAVTTDNPLGVMTNPTTVTTENAPIVVAGATDLRMAKTHSPDQFEIGSLNNTYSFAVQNVGDQDSSATDPIVLTDTLPAGMSFSSIVTAQDWICTTSNANTTLRCEYTEVLAGATDSTAGETAPVITISVVVSGEPRADVTNEAFVSGGGDATGAESTDTVNVVENLNIDTDRDGVPDAIDLDDDNDGILDIDEQVDGVDVDSDGDGLLDRLDIDSDNDGITDLVESQPEGTLILPTGEDDDNDGVDNAFEGFNAINPVDTDGDNIPDFQDTDSDNDNVPDAIEGHDANSDGIPDVDPIDGDYVDADMDGLDDRYDTVDRNAVAADVAAETNSAGGNAPLQNTDGEDNRDWRDTDDDNDGIPTSAEDTNLNGDFSDDDSDGDGIPDYLDPDQDPNRDTDRDGIPDVNDLDDDNDGIPDTLEQNDDGTDRDSDGDGIIDRLDIDSDNDGIPDLIEAQAEGQPLVTLSGDDVNNDGLDDAFEGANALDPVDTDNDGIPDFQDTDSDNDNVPDFIEGHDANSDGIPDIAPIDGDYVDADLDGLDDRYDTVDRNAVAADVAAQTNSAGSNAPLQNTDGVDNRDWRDTDDDNDGISTIAEDTDGDGDFSNDDADNDGIPNYLDPDFVDTDTDRDGIPNQQDLDDDNDGIPDTLEQNPDGSDRDTDGDGIVDRLDIDSDNDGIVDLIEAQPEGQPLVLVSGIDENNDGLDDVFEGANALDPVDTDGDNIPDFQDSDSDNDGVIDAIEGHDANSDGVPAHTPIDGDYVDADRDGLDDRYDVIDRNAVDADFASQNNSGPNGNDAALQNTDGEDNRDWRDTDDDNDGLLTIVEDRDLDGDYADDDSDNDGIPNYLDPDSDIDRDDKADNVDIDDDNDGIPDALEQNPDGSDRDTDGDGIVDRLDIDSDNDGIPDLVEAQPEGQPLVTLSGNDSDNDGLDDAFEGVNALNPVDTDDDGIPDFQDTDSDNDNVPDLIEGHDANSDGIPDRLPSGNDEDLDGLDDNFDTVNRNIVNEVIASRTNSAGSNAALQNTDGEDNRDWRDTDDDNDGVSTIAEDTNGNGDFSDDDADNDGIPNYLDPDFIDTDTDRDGILNAVDLDDDNDGIPDVLEQNPDGSDRDTDGDGIVDRLDIDSDNDGIVDLIEAQPEDQQPTLLSGIDANNDGLDDAFEGANALDPVDTDGDDIPDFQDTDSDNDTVPDAIEGHDNDSNGVADVVPSGVDTDLDGLDDAYDTLNRNTADAEEAANSNAAASNAPLQNTDNLDSRDWRDTDDDEDGVPTIREDADGDGDPTNDDSDNDGIPDYLDPDSAPPVVGEDNDRDGVPNDEDLDDDNDGIPDTLEQNADGSDRDTDGDGVPDRLDIDSDNDGIVDLIEAQSEDDFVTLTGEDSDGDGLDNAFDPDNSGKVIDPIDTDGDDTPDYIDLDSDGDNVPDYIEGNDANQDGIADQPQVTLANFVDNDGDGLDDRYDTLDMSNLPDGPSATAARDNSDASNAPLQNTDGEDNRDWRDTDDDNDGAPTATEFPSGDSNGDGRPDYLDPTVISPIGGVVENAIALTKTANRTEAVIGDLVLYTVTAENITADSRVLENIVLADDLPGSFRLVEDSLFVERTGETAVPLTATGTDPLFINLGELGSGETVTVTYLVQVGAGVQPGIYTNKIDPTIGGSFFGQTASASIEIVQDAIFEETTIIGKVFNDINGDGVQDAGEAGIPGVRLATVEGLVIETDQYGRYHVAAVEGAKFYRTRQFIAKVDTNSLPAGSVLTTENPRVLPITQALMSRANFGVRLPESNFVAVDTCKPTVDYVDTRTKVLRNVVDAIYFDSGRAVIDSDDIQTLRNLIQMLNDKENVRVRVIGHTDSTAVGLPRTLKLYGNNKVLSEARAKVVVDALSKALKLPTDKFDVSGKGAAQPVATNKTKEGRAKNRRAEIEVTYDEVKIAKRKVTKDCPQGSAGTGLGNGAAGTSSTAGQIWSTEDPLVVDPRLNIIATSPLEVTGNRAGGEVQFRLYSNYSAFIERAEIVIYNNSDEQLTKPLTSVAVKEISFGQLVTWNVNVPVSVGDDLVYVLKAYDAAGRTDSTAPRVLRVVEAGSVEGDSDEGKQIFGDSNLAEQHIQVDGSRVRVRGIELTPNSTIQINNEPVLVDAGGQFVYEQHLPVGEHRINVATTDSAQQASKALNVNVEGEKFFMVGIASLTIGQTDVSGNIEPLNGDERFTDDSVYTDGRLAFYAKGKIKGEYLITAHLDTTEDDLSNLGDNLSRKDASSIFRRLDPDRYYPVYGDDSTTTSDVNTQGAIYVRVDWDESMATWGNYNTGLTRNEFAQYSRSLYGAQLVYKAPYTTEYGDNRVSITAFGAEALTAQGQNTFRATGGSLYYLRDTDIVRGSEKIWIEVRRRDTEQAVDNMTLQEGKDYEIDYIQGRIILRRPLTQVVATRNPSIIQDEPLEGDDVFLHVGYEYVPQGFSSEDLTAGVTAQGWVTDSVGLGGTYVTEEQENGVDYTLAGGDVTVKLSEDSYVKAEFATSESNQRSSDFTSLDGGLSFQDSLNDPVVSAALADQQEGDAISAEIYVAMQDIVDRNGFLKLWYKDRDAGFSGTGRLNEGTATTDVGIEANIDATDRLQLSLRANEIERDVAGLGTNVTTDTTISVQADLQATDALQLGAEVQLDSEEANGVTTDATLAGLRVDYAVTNNTTIYGKAQTVISSDDNYADNDQVGVGFSSRISDRFALGLEAITGDRGDALNANIDYAISNSTRVQLSGGVGDGATSSIGANYLGNSGYELYGTYSVDPDHTNGKTSTLTVGQRQAFGNSLKVFGEHQFSNSANEAGIGHTFGIDYSLNEAWLLTMSLQRSELELSNSNDSIERNVVSVGTTYQADKVRGSLKVEYREDESTGGATLDAEQVLVSGTIDYQANADWALLGRANVSRTESSSDTGEALGRFSEVSLGFAYRPVDNDRFNMLGKYTFLYDQSGVGQNTNRSNDERAHILSLEGLYDLTDRWELGAKVAHKQNSIRTGRGTGQWFDSTASLGVIRARYHFVKSWDAVAEYRHLTVEEAEQDRSGVLLAIYRHLGSHMKVGVGYNFTEFSDDLTDDGYEAGGWFIDIIGKF